MRKVRGNRKLVRWMAQNPGASGDQAVWEEADRTIVYGIRGGGKYERPTNLHMDTLAKGGAAVTRAFRQGGGARG